MFWEFFVNNLVGYVEDISVYMVFICVFYFVNEYGLVIKSVFVMDDLCILNVLCLVN